MAHGEIAKAWDEYATAKKRAQETLRFDAGIAAGDGMAQAGVGLQEARETGAPVTMADAAALLLIRLEAIQTMSRWIRVQTSIFDHEAFASEPFTEREAWLWLISNAAWKETKHRIGNDVLNVPIGSLL
ncbi:hypothetical protein [Sinorhizobium psoraleae]|uniref:Uncharacterized protein n=1 Tax=Sinorhizobium psoraleae TaxID=520838 RepID=A0ABT4KBN4_9HYPH|nr:hypothetical protein [Sinorhizobium psoraleae]MCZ4089351.1 hypothetical protein [Sinorhizobium psoraleae]